MLGRRVHEGIDLLAIGVEREALDRCVGDEVRDALVGGRRGIGGGIRRGRRRRRPGAMDGVDVGGDRGGLRRQRTRPGTAACWRASTSAASPTELTRKVPSANLAGARRSPICWMWVSSWTRRVALRRRVREHDQVADHERRRAERFARQLRRRAGERLDVIERRAELLLELGLERQADPAAFAPRVLDELGGVGARLGGVLDALAERARELAGLDLVAIVGPRHAAAGRRGAARVLRDVGDLVSDQLDACGGVRVVGAGREVDVVADRERASLELRGGLMGAAIVVQPDAAEIDTQLGPELVRQLGRQRVAAARFFDDPERGDQAGFGAGVAIVVLGPAIDPERPAPQQPRAGGLGAVAGLRAIICLALAGHRSRQRLGVGILIRGASIAQRAHEELSAVVFPRHHVG